jgi:hypothetical protein
LSSKLPPPSSSTDTDVKTKPVWDKASGQRIREIEAGVKREFYDVINDPQKASQVLELLLTDSPDSFIHLFTFLVI